MPEARCEKTIKNPRLKELAAEIRFLQERRNAWQGVFNLKVAPCEKERENARSAMVEILRHKGVRVLNNGKTFFTKHLSGGCRSCLRGENYNFVPTFDCNRSCFFCYQPRFSKSSPDVKNIYHSPVLEVGELLRRKNMESFSVSGGEPLLLPGKVIRAVSEVKKRFGSACRTHLYTNGVCATASILKRLQKAGLDEIRINLTAGNYRLAAVRLAKSYIPDVIVEIPVIPEEEKEIKMIMPRLDRLGVFCLNLHELLFLGYRPEEYFRRGYFLKSSRKRPFYSELAIPVFRSEETAFGLLGFAASRNYRMSVHYCSSDAKQEVQHINKRKRCALTARREHEKVTERGLLEKLVIYKPECCLALKDLKRNNVPSRQIYFNRKKKRLEVHPAHIVFLDLEKYEVGRVRSLPDLRDVELRVY